VKTPRSLLTHVLYRKATVKWTLSIASSAILFKNNNYLVCVMTMENENYLEKTNQGWGQPWRASTSGNDKNPSNAFTLDTFSEIIERFKNVYHMNVALLWIILTSLKMFSEYFICRECFRWIPLVKTIYIVGSDFHSRYRESIWHKLFHQIMVQILLSNGILN
jgi:hypothetical protein